LLVIYLIYVCIFVYQKTNNMKTMTTSYTKAVKIAKEILKDTHNVKRLTSLIKSTSCTCGCGESPAITVSAIIKDEYYDVTVGICKEC
jgi:hypothetical protein